MSCLWQFPSYVAAIFRTSSRFTQTSLNICSAGPWKTKFDCNPHITHLSLHSTLTTFHARLYSSGKGSKNGGRGSSRLHHKLKPEPAMELEKNAFYVVRKGDVVGVYTSLSDCQAQVGSSICDPPVSVYKGYHLPKDAAEYLVSRGLKNSIYTIRAADLKEDLFGTLVHCAFQDPASSLCETAAKDTSKKRSQQEFELKNVETIGSTSMSNDPLKKHVKLDNFAAVQVASSDGRSCILEFDGASKGNPGQAGAGAVLRTDDGLVICRLREGLGTATNNVAEYRAMILGLKYALKRGFYRIRVQGDSKLVCMQVQGLWKVKNENMAYLYEEVKKLKEKFTSFQIDHVLRDLNAEADVQANLAVSLLDGQVQEESEIS
ncbi:uncharacterized protein LOC107419636 isoform X2 [Ziziphus jujuba]|uniref:Uncharacterized protein LOC107419636 isoform X2 n=1 Tax=Ziziphus jujuba TaxID=326968 RepID=A0ABM3IJ69_ZIZJJ|nr:uncharacterized protein LOC107419636 isoform X2 [Ziziphus jujuba]XP_048329554.1 uncharacterized protein LOC107419636 isoform X2 [Ziziphus jujuba]